MAYVRRGVWLAIFVGALVGGWEFAGNNAAPVRVDYVFGAVGAVPLWVALLTSFGLGAAVTAFALFARLTRSSLAQRRYRKTVASLESEVHQLRNLPVEGEREVTEVPVPELPAAASAGSGEFLDPAASAESSHSPDSPEPGPPVEVAR
jgi:uncharacterized integral membrane protein